jgi:anti-sigma factor RsiW
LHEYVDDELNPRDLVEQQIRQSMMAHLSRCERCARLEAQLQSMRQALAAVGARARMPAARRTHHEPS